MCPREQNYIDRAGIMSSATACMQARPCSISQSHTQHVCTSAVAGALESAGLQARQTTPLTRRPRRAGKDGRSGMACTSACAGWARARDPLACYALHQEAVQLQPLPREQGPELQVAAGETAHSQSECAAARTCLHMLLCSSECACGIRCTCQQLTAAHPLAQGQGRRTPKWPPRLMAWMRSSGRCRYWTSGRWQRCTAPASTRARSGPSRPSCASTVSSRCRCARTS